MLFHVSVEADDPRRTAALLAEFWGGEAFPFPAVTPGAWMAMAPDDRGTIIEVYPRGTELHPADDGAIGVRVAPRRHNATHFAIATRMSRAQVMAIAAREGIAAGCFQRGGRFGVIELWIDGCMMIEVLTEEMQRDYMESISIPNARAMVAAMSDHYGIVADRAA